MFVSSSKGVQKNLYQGACALTMAGLLTFSAGAAPAYSADVAPGAPQTNLTQGVGQPTSAAENFVWGFSSQFHQLVAKAQFILTVAIRCLAMNFILSHPQSRSPMGAG